MYIIISTEPKIFKPITYPNVRQGLYSISNYGDIYSHIQHKILKQVVNKNGYCEAYLRAITKTRINVTVHRLVAWEFCKGYDDTHYIVNHLDSCRSNNYYENLEWCTPSENTIHGFTDGEINRYGENNHTNKYSLDTILDIKHKIELGMRDIEIMNSYGYKKTRDNIPFRDLIYSVRHKKTWSHI